MTIRLTSYALLASYLCMGMDNKHYLTVGYTKTCGYIPVCGQIKRKSRENLKEGYNWLYPAGNINKCAIASYVTLYRYTIVNIDCGLKFLVLA